MVTVKNTNFDLGNILNTVENIKTARQNRLIKNRGMAKEDATIEGTLDAETSKTTTAKNPTTGNAILKNETAEPDGSSTSTTVASNGEKTVTKQTEETAEPDMKGVDDYKNKLRELTKIQKTKELQKIQQQTDARTKLYIRMGYSPAMAKNMAQMKIDELKKFEEVFKSKNANEQVRMRQEIKKNGDKLMTVRKLGKEKPLEAEKMFQNYRTDLMSKINELRKNGRNNEADALEGDYKELPPTLLVKNNEGKDEFNVKWVDEKIIDQGQAMKTADDVVKEEVATTKFKNEKEKIELQKIADIEKEKAKPRQQFVKTVGDKDYLFKYNKETGQYDINKTATSNALLKAKAKAKGTGGLKVSDIRNYQKDIRKEVATGLEAEFRDGNYVFKSQEERAKYTQASKLAEQETLKQLKEGKTPNLSKITQKALIDVGIVPSNTQKRIDMATKGKKLTKYSTYDDPETGWRFAFKEKSDGKNTWYPVKKIK